MLYRNRIKTNRYFSFNVEKTGLKVQSERSFPIIMNFQALIFIIIHLILQFNQYKSIFRFRGTQKTPPCMFFGIFNQIYGSLLSSVEQYFQEFSLFYFELYSQFSDHLLSLNGSIAALISKFLRENIFSLINKIKQIMNELRQKILAEEDKLGSKSRFGLFSQAPPIAVGDDSMYGRKQHQRGGDGKPITKPPQLLAGTCKSGKTKSSYFSVPKSIYIEDKYHENHKLQAQYQKKMHSKATFHENEFKPASGSKSLMKPSYEYKEQKEGQVKKVVKDDGGRVKTQPPNIITNPNSKIQQTFLKYPKYIEDPYERKAQIDREYAQKQKQKTLSDVPMFKSASHGNRAFQKDSSAYGEDEKMQSTMKKKNIKMKTLASQVIHQGPFKPGIKPNTDPIGKYPQFLDVKNPLPKNTQTSFQKPSNTNKQLWKPNSFSKSRPTPSIGLNTKNLHLHCKKV